MNDLQAIAEQINVVAAAHPRMRNFQEIRRKIHGLSRLKTKKIFSEQTIFKHWAAHSGGRHELQYNIGFEDEWFRYGVAFSLQPSRTLPNPSVLKPRIARYNRYIQKNGSSLADLSFWYWSNGVRSPSLPVAEIPDTLIRPPNFLFLGKTCERDEIDPDTVVFLFDRLLDLYQYVEGNTPLTTRPANLQKGFQFKSGCAQKATSAWANVKGGARNVNLAHNGLQARRDCQRHLADARKNAASSDALVGHAPDADRRVCLLALCARAVEPGRLARRLRLTRRMADVLAACARADRLRSFDGAPAEAVICAAAIAPERAAAAVRFLEVDRHVRPLLDGADVMRELAIRSSPRVGDVLEALRRAKVAGELPDREAELAFVRALA